MAKALIQTLDINQAIAYEQTLPPGKYEVLLIVSSPISQDALNQLHDHFLDRGFDVKTIIQEYVKNQWQIRIKYQIHPMSSSITWAPQLIAALPAVMIAIVVAIGIFRIEAIGRAALPIVLTIMGFTVIAIALVREPLGKAGGRYIEKRF